MTASRATAGRFDPALDRLRAEGLVAYPTETVWGLGAAAHSERAIGRLRAWKGGHQPLALLVAAPSALEPLGFQVSEVARRLVARFWPGPLTLVLPCEARFARDLVPSAGGVGVRCSSHPLAAGLASCLAAAALGPITVTSLNRHGKSPARCRHEAAALAGESGDGPLLVAEGGEDAGGLAPSTVVDLASGAPRVVREGALARTQIEQVLGKESGR